MNHKLDTDEKVLFYEQEFYVLSNFSAFKLIWKGILFDTSEQAYHWEKFVDHPSVQEQILRTQSAHDAFKTANYLSSFKLPDWDDIKLEVMKEILQAKVAQHEYVRRKLLETGDRELVEDSWRDDFWGVGPNGDGKNWLGRLWMQIRDAIKEDVADAKHPTVVEGTGSQTEQGRG